MKPKTLVLYHANCVDGFTAAWAFRLHLGDDAEYLPVNYQQAPPDVAGRTVFVLDFSYPRDVMEQMHDEASSLLVLDHHKTAQGALDGLPFARFDMNRSGARMAWDWGAPLGELARTRTRPWLIDYVEDRDLWRWQLPDSQAVNAYIGTVPRSFQEWDRLSTTRLDEIVVAGQGALAFIGRYVREMALQSRIMPFANCYVPVVNAPYICTSELVGELAEGQPFAVGWFQRADGKFQYSLRSREGGVDVSEVAKRHGGGGHKHSAGFVLDTRIF